MIYCPKCRKPSAGKSPECPHCGGKLPKPKKKKSKKKGKDQQQRELQKTKAQSSLSRKQSPELRPVAEEQKKESKQKESEAKPKEQNTQKAPAVKFAKVVPGKNQSSKPVKKKSPKKEWLRIGEILVRAKTLNNDQLELALKKQKDAGRRIGEILVEEKFVTELQLVQALSYQTDIVWIDLEGMEIDSDLFDIVSLDTGRTHRFIPVDTGESEDGTELLFLAMENPLDRAAIQAARSASGMRIEPRFALPSAIDKALDFMSTNGESETESRIETHAETEAEIDSELAPEPETAEQTNTDEWSLPSSSSLPKTEAEKTPLAKVNIVKKQVPVASIVDTDDDPEEKDGSNPDEAQEQEVQPSDEETFDEVELTNLQFVDRSSSEPKAPFQGEHADSLDVESKLLKELRALDESPADVSRLKEYVIALLEIMFRKNLVMPFELEEEINRDKS